MSKYNWIIAIVIGIVTAVWGCFVHSQIEQLTPEVFMLMIGCMLSGFFIGGCD